MNVWNQKKPIRVLAPMHDVTDAAFRQLLVHIAKPDIMMTEFVSVDGLCHEISQKKMIQYYLPFKNEERPLIAQIWGTDPEKFYKSTKIITELGFDGVDINMGCPDKKVVGCGGGAALINDGGRAKEIIHATKNAAETLPVSVKTRIGFQNDIAEEWITHIAECLPSAITIHFRTKKELSRVPAHWERAQICAAIIHAKGIIAIGNGDVRSHTHGVELCNTSGMDGYMVGRGVLGNPWFFDASHEEKNISTKDRLATLLQHIQFFTEMHGGIKNFAMLKKHVRGYINGFNGASTMRLKIMNTKSLEEIQSVVRELYNAEI